MSKIDETPWLTWMLSHLGEHEVSGYSHNPFIVSLFKHTSFKAITDETPWCAACVCAALEETGFKGSNSAAASSYLSWGRASELVPGSVVVVNSGPKSYHVGICHKVISCTRFELIGGNQNNELNITVFKTSSIAAIRWPYP